MWMRLKEYCQRKTRNNDGFNPESIQFGIVSGTVLYQHGMDYQGLRGYKEDFHD